MDLETGQRIRLVKPYYVYLPRDCDNAPSVRTLEVGAALGTVRSPAASGLPDNVAEIQWDDIPDWPLLVNHDCLEGESPLDDDEVNEVLLSISRTFQQRGS